MAVELKKLREMDVSQLAKEEMDLREEVWKLRLQITTGQLQDPSKVRRKRRDLARVMTIKREQALANQKGDRR
ncbi:MAG: 50S ribosomal protein L29 [bacterium]|nr:50S ribosomal protein L29 [bacterium]